MGKGTKAFLKGLKWFDTYFEIIYIASAILLITVVITAQIVCRKLFGFSIVWSEEMSRHLFIIMGIWAFSLSIRENTAIKFDIIMLKMSEKTKLVFTSIADAIIAVYFAILLPTGFGVTAMQRSTTSTAMPYNMSFIYIWVMIGVFLIIVRSVEVIIRNIIKIKRLSQTPSDPDGAKKAISAESEDPSLCS